MPFGQRVNEYFCDIRSLVRVTVDSIVPRDDYSFGYSIDTLRNVELSVGITVTNYYVLCNEAVGQRFGGLIAARDM